VSRSLHSIQNVNATQTLYRDYETIKCLTLTILRMFQEVCPANYNTHVHFIQDHNRIIALNSTYISTNAINLKCPSLSIPYPSPSSLFPSNSARKSTKPYSTPSTRTCQLHTSLPPHHVYATEPNLSISSGKAYPSHPARSCIAVDR
jgi:hypothetical protein